MVMPRSRSSGALSIWSKAVYLLAEERVASTLVMAAVRVVLPWSMWPIVPTFTWVLVRSNFCFAMSSSRLGPRSPSLLAEVGPLPHPAPCRSVFVLSCDRPGPCRVACRLRGWRVALALLAADSGHDLARDRGGHFLVGVELHRVRRA